MVSRSWRMELLAIGWLLVLNTAHNPYLRGLAIGMAIVSVITSLASAGKDG